MTLIDSWMPAYDVKARYAIRIPAPPAQVYATLLATDFSRPWLVRGLMGIRKLPSFFSSPGSAWRRLIRHAILGQVRREAQTRASATVE
jgi:uncharacterized protein YndB with AHSA1/START domain